MKVDVDTSSIEEFGNTLSGRLKQALANVATNAVTGMVLRVRAGKGLDDKPMQPYSKEYAKKRESKGRTSEKRDLTMTGQMAGAIHLEGVKETSTGLVATIGMAGARNRELARYHQQREPWFGFSPKDEADIREDLADEVARAVEGF